MTVTETIQKCADKICDEYCKFPEQYFSKYADEHEAEEKLYRERCDKCILNELV